MNNTGQDSSKEDKGSQDLEEIERLQKSLKNSPHDNLSSGQFKLDHPAPSEPTDGSSIDHPYSLQDLALFFLGLIIGAMMLPIAADLLEPLLPSLDPLSAFIVLMLISYVLIAAFMIYIGPVRYNRGLDTLGFTNFRIGGLFRAAGYLFTAYLINVAYGAAIYYGFGITEVSETVEEIKEIFGASESGFYMAFFIVGLVAPIVEEMVFRGFLFSILSKYYGFLTSAVFSAAVFAMFHVSLLALFPIFVLGILMATLFQKEQSIYPPIFFHAANNTFALMVVYYV